MSPSHDKQSVYHGCTRFLSLDPPLYPQRKLAELAAYLPTETTADKYGEGAVTLGNDEIVAAIRQLQAALVRQRTESRTA
ncbi:MAG: hypothetical protein ACFCUT_07070 [Kiloniellaceae bacterium]